VEGDTVRHRGESWGIETGKELRTEEPKESMEGSESCQSHEVTVTKPGNPARRVLGAFSTVGKTTGTGVISDESQLQFEVDFTFHYRIPLIKLTKKGTSSEHDPPPPLQKKKEEEQSRESICILFEIVKPNFSIPLYLFQSLSQLLTRTQNRKS
jgi:hypothetical protein